MPLGFTAFNHQCVYVRESLCSVSDRFQYWRSY